ncbi:MAG: DUF2235 domain-containing protein [Aquabacterium sp.]|uniref:T6SS phospholipase effector Tle1-like catalytic domain-containing protein n=1 Tax=Aquabacterium sp. TaxID=1872578 RepID=UPI00121D693A|nr:DUF2235 domain-containing protein [Aquabacterium sp.]TAK93870.1 MAG: DUF2235 domain-containing protein [Aquabacterium sp.]
MTTRPRQLVVCCDGTNNTLTAGQNDTNVLKLYAHLNAQEPAQDVDRVLYYDPGVGSPDSVPPTDLFDWGKRTWERLSGLASGRGIYDNIEQAYLFLMRHWRGPQDQIYLFGFSRGAFTVRCLAGMVNLFGIIRPEHEPLVPTLIRIYFSQPRASKNAVQTMTRRLHAAGHKKVFGREDLAEQVKAQFATAQGREAWVHWVGVWDTVESVGLPGPLSRSNPGTATLRNKRIHHVRHALSLDEHRWTFAPRLYEEPGNLDQLDEQGLPMRTLRQVWYPGVHCDAGGSYDTATTGVSDMALKWMVDELRVEMDITEWSPPVLNESRDPVRFVKHDPLWDTPWWALLGMMSRDMQPQVVDPWNTDARTKMTVIPAPMPMVALESVWQHSRPWRHLALAFALGLVAMLISGMCLLPSQARELSWHGLMAAASQAGGLAAQQIGVWLPTEIVGIHTLPWNMVGQPAWAMVWDLAFIACWGYIVARFSSRAFARLVGPREPNTPMPALSWLGMAPLAAVGGDVCEDLLTLMSLGAHGLGSDALATFVWWFVPLASVIKVAGLLCVVALVVGFYRPVGGASRRSWHGIEAIEDDETHSHRH